MRKDRTKLYSGEALREPGERKLAPYEKGPGRFDRRHANFLVSIGLMFALLTIFLWKTRHVPDRVRQIGCVGHLRQIGQALTMYVTDYDQDPPPEEFPRALYAYLQGSDTGPDAEQARQEFSEVVGRPGRVQRQVLPKEATEVFYCPGDRERSDPTSYLYVDPRRFSAHARNLSDSVQPWVVDEVFHQPVVILHRDGHVELHDKDYYLRTTRRMFRIEQPVPGTTAPPPKAPVQGD